MTSLAQPLAGIRVLDLASLYAAPLISSLLADHGAEVLKVEPPAGDSYRSWSAMWALVGRGKRSLALDLRCDEGVELLLRLLPDFDVVVENLPRRLAEERGLTPEALRAHKPSLVVVSATGFGPDGPEAGRPANGTVAEAFTGLTDLTGETDGAPMLPSIPLGDAVAAAFGAMGALAGIVRQLQTGDGATIDLTVYEPMLHALGPPLTAHVPGTPPPLRDGGAMGLPLRGTFPASDDRYIALNLVMPRHVDVVSQLIGHVEAEGGPSLREHFASWMIGRTRSDALGELIPLRIPVSPVNDLEEVIREPQVEHRQSLVRLGESLVACPTPRIDGGVAPAPPPALGDANSDLLEEGLGLSKLELEALRQKGVVP
jgi:crotonobetainyl-CoA:carnitine CoA-transferase CaiB-like acyl-CoA transferase